MSTKNPCIGYVNSVESFGSVDGPGVRYMFFMQGCPMRCKYCHNPETWALEGGEEYTPQQAFDKAWRYRNYWKNGGGITVSGGEAMMQTDFVTELFAIAKQHNVNTALDTAGVLFQSEGKAFEQFQKLAEVTDLFILDIKEWNDERHIALTGHSNKQVLKMAEYLTEIGKPMWIRHVLVPGITDHEEDLKELAEFIKGLKTVERVEILPYHTLGLAKYVKMGLAYPLDGVPTPTKEQIRKAEEILGIPEHS